MKTKKSILTAVLLGLFALTTVAIPSLARANDAPIADAGGDRNAYNGQSIVLLGGASDAENEPIVYWTWRVEQAPAGAIWSLLFDYTANPYFIASTAGDFVLSLVVGDASGVSLSDYATVHVADNLLSVSFAPIEELLPGEWYEVPDSRLYDVSPQPPPGREPGCGTSSTGSIMRAWSGGAYDTYRDRLIIWGGGHLNYAGNEVYAFDINTLQWSRITDPSPTTHCDGSLNIESGQTDYRINGDGTPVAHETYDGLEYIPTIDRFLAKGAAIWPQPKADQTVWMFNFNNSEWERKADATNLPSPMSAYDPVTGHVFLHDPNHLYEYDPSNDKWTLRNYDTGAIPESMTAEIDPVSHRFIMIGLGKVYYYDLDDIDATGKLRRKELTTIGDNEIIYTFAPGLVYDPVADKFVAWAGTTKMWDSNLKKWVPTEIGDAVYVLDLDTFAWTKYSPIGSVAPPKSNTLYNHGTYGRWRYIPSKNVLIGVNSVYGNVYFYRLPEILSTYYKDADGDGYGSPNNPVKAYEPPPGYVRNDGDCDDTTASIHPGAVEGPAGNITCSDGKDNDCDGLIDAAAPGCMLQADLIISSLTVPSQGIQGAIITITDTTKNQGKGTAGASTAKFYWSTNSTWDAGDAYLGERQVPALAAGATNSGSTSVTIPSVTAGTYYIIAKADANNTNPNETIETNNNKSKLIKIGLPDLIVSALTAPTTSGAGKLISVTDTTKNQGGGTSVASTTKLYLSTNSTWDTGDTYLGERAVGSLAAGDTNSGSTSVTIPAVVAGTYYIIAKADANNTNPTETDETNNTKSKSIKIGPDLMVSALTAPTSSGAGKTISVTDTTKNQGGGTSVASTTKLYLSTNSTWDAGDTYLGERAVGPLAAGATNSGSTSVTIPAVTGGTYYIIAKADANNTNPTELNENNNTKSKSIKIGPDLVVSAITAPTSAVRGSTIKIKDTTKNSGGGDVGASTTKLYLSTNSTWDAGDAYLGERMVASLAAGTSNAVETSVIIPSGIATGTYYIIAVSDANKVVVETNETNNNKAKTITIN